MAPQLLAASPLSAGGMPLSAGDLFASGATSFAFFPAAAGAAGGARRSGMLSVAGPVGLLAAPKGRRLVVVAAAAAAPGSSDDTPSSDPQAAVCSFRMELELYKLSPRPIQFHGPPELFHAATMTAQDSVRLFECLLSNNSVDPDTYKELVLRGKSFVNVEGQCADGYLRSDALIYATQSVKTVGMLIFPTANMVDFTIASALLSDKEAYLNHLVQAFVVHYIAVAGEARDRYGFDMIGRP